ncbi:MAG TPA: hypothetical protein VLL98_01085 [Rickettsiales bacterium]|nr:hypothetical protein [Rickettsiales bacterium]
MEEELEKLENIINKDELVEKAHEVLIKIASNVKNIEYFLNKHSDSLINYSEEYDFLTKISLYNTKNDKFRLRLHIFLPGYSNRIHYHRWDYCSCILKGGYKHYIYCSENEFKINNYDISTLTPKCIQYEETWNFYYLENSLLHSVEAKPNSISLFLKFPSVKDKFIVIDKKNNNYWWQYGAKQETKEEKQNKILLPNRLEFFKQLIINQLKEKNE